MFYLLGSNILENIVANNDICEIKPNPICALVEQLEEESHLEQCTAVGCVTYVRVCYFF